VQRNRLQHLRDTDGTMSEQSSARGRTSGFEMEQRSPANFFALRDGRVTGLVGYRNRERELAGLGLED
jgi:hypothetical protein